MAVSFQMGEVETASTSRPSRKTGWYGAQQTCTRGDDGFRLEVDLHGVPGVDAGHPEEAPVE